MIIAHYRHRLPANYDIKLIRSRANERGALWDAIPELYFKGFLLREKGKYGVIENSYASLYLWRQDEAFRDFLLKGRYMIVTDSFGRAPIQALIALDAVKGSSSKARFLYKEQVDIPPDDDLSIAFAREVERNRETAASLGTLAAVVGVDTEHWRFIRIRLSENEPVGMFQGLAYELLYLAQPLLGSLPGHPKP